MPGAHTIHSLRSPVPAAHAQAVQAGQTRRVLELAATSRLSAYDCEILILAQEMDSRLLTEDSGILDQFPDLALSLNDFLK